jgi:hypothetical protein
MAKASGPQRVLLALSGRPYTIICKSGRERRIKRERKRKRKSKR